MTWPAAGVKVRVMQDLTQRFDELREREREYRQLAQEYQEAAEKLDALCSAFEQLGDLPPLPSDVTEEGVGEGGTLRDGETILDACVRLMKDGPMAVSDLARLLGKSQPAIYTSLVRSDGRRVHKRRDSKWEVVPGASTSHCRLCGFPNMEHAQNCPGGMALASNAGRALLDRLNAAEAERDALRAEVEKESALRAELTDEVRRLRARVDAVGQVLAENGCDCECECPAMEHDDDCDRCIACRVQDVIDVVMEGGAK